eukprot:66408_1
MVCNSNCMSQALKWICLRTFLMIIWAKYYKSNANVTQDGNISLFHKFCSNVNYHLNAFIYHQYGIQRPFAWQEFVYHKMYQDEMKQGNIRLLRPASMIRDPSIKKKYEKQKKEVINKYCKYSDWVNITFLQYNKEMISHGGGYKLRAVLPNEKHTYRILRKDNFPYILEKGIEHFNLWSTGMKKRLREK